MEREKNTDVVDTPVSRRRFLQLTGTTAAMGAAVGGLTVLPKKQAFAAEPQYVQSDVIKRTVCCPNCTGSCAVEARIKDGVLVGVQPGNFPDNRFKRMCLKGVSNAMQRVYSESRIKYPMRRVGERGSGEWEQLSWEEAMDYIVGKHKEISQKYGPRANSWISMTGSYGAITQVIAGRAANSVGGTSFTSFGIMGDNASNMGMLPSLGVQQEGHSWDDLAGSNLSLFFGCNYFETTVNDSHFVMDAIDNGCKVVVIDPRFSRTAAKADWWIPVRPGTDAALILGMTQHIVANKLYDMAYLKRYTVAPLLVRADTKDYLHASDLGQDGDGYVAWDAQANEPIVIVPNRPPDYPNHAEYQVTDPEKYVPEHGDEVAIEGTFTVKVGDTEIACTPAWQLYADNLKGFTPENMSAVCEVPVEDIVKLAELYATTNPASIRMSQGVQRYWQGHQAFRAGAVLAGVCGNVGMKHAGFTWSDGSLMRLLFSVPAEWVLPVPDVAGESIPGTTFIDHIITEQPYPVKSLWVVAYGMGTQAPERTKLFGEAFDNLELVVVNEMVMTPAAQMADVVLPVTTYYEERGDVIGAWSNRYIQVRERAIEPLGEAKSDWQIFKLYAEKMGIGQYWDMDDVESGRMILEKSPNPQFSKMDFDKLYSEGVAEMVMPEAYYAFADLRFPTPTGRIQFYNPELTAFGEEFPTYCEPVESNRSDKAQEYPLTFMNCRSVYTCHSQHTQLPWIREVNPEPHLEMHPDDAAARKLTDGDKVEVFNDRGSFKVKVFLTEGIKPGCVNIREGWWPEDLEDGHYADLLHMQLNPVQDAISETNYAPYDNLVQVRKA